MNESDHFEFSAKVSYDGPSRTLKLDYHYRSKADAVAPEAIGEYMAALDRVDKVMDYYVSRPVADGASGRGKDWSEWIRGHIGYIAIALLVALGIYCLLEWWLDARKPVLVDGGPYYAVSVRKFLLLFIATLGLYQLFWFYKNWAYVKSRDTSDIMPFWRAVFSLFWYYPFYLDLAQDSQRRFGRSLLPAAPWFAILLILMLGVNLGDRIAAELDLIYLLSAVCYLPFVAYILRVNTHTPEGFRRNSRIRPRHLLLGGTAAIFLLFNLGCLLYWIPSGEVVKGNRLPSWEVAFLQKQGLLKADNQLLYFYSDAFLHTRHDGNGITDTNVFSYWYDEERKTTLSKSIDYGEIDDIDVKFAASEGDNTVITIIPKNGASFILYASSERGRDKLFVAAIQERLTP